tara:strand:- start:156 stop:842 length:687 start_codon:yes stop_codon:yes gene_type:complete
MYSQNVTFLYNQYLENSILILTDIYNLIIPFSSSHTTLDEYTTMLTIKILCEKFIKKREDFCEMANGNIKFDFKIPPSWNDLMQVKNIYNKNINIEIEFYIDHPKLNMYGIIICDQGVETHYLYNITAESNLHHTIELSENVQLSFRDTIIDSIRLGDAIKKGKIIYQMKNLKLIRLPFSNNTIMLDNHDWVMCTLKRLEQEIQRIGLFGMQSNNNNTPDTNIHLLYN